MTRVLDWLGERTRGSRATQVPAGTPHTVRVSGRHLELTLRRPSGDAEIHAVTGSEWTVRDTQAVGIYRYTVSGIRRYFAVNLTDEIESNIAPRYRPSERLQSDDDASAMAQVALPLWPWLAGLGCLALLLEWVARCSGGRRA